MERTIDLKKKYLTGGCMVPMIWLKLTAGTVKDARHAAGDGNLNRAGSLDIYRMSAGLNVSFEGMIDQVIELNVVDGVILPNLKMDGDEGGMRLPG